MKTEQPDLCVSEDTDTDFVTFLHSKIISFNNENSPHHKSVRKPGMKKPLNIILRDKSGEIIGGISSETYWNWLVIEDFYLPENLRGQGIGVRILNKVEFLARERGCTSAQLTTYNFQARDFYRKQGWYVVGELENYPPGSVYCWMRKELSKNSSSGSEINSL